MTDERRGRPPRAPLASDAEGQPPTHPTRQALVLLVAVTLLIVALAIVSSYDVL